ncbi:MAG: HPr(Ser) kinase/phosphatase [Polyangiales bacterium]
MSDEEAGESGAFAVVPTRASQPAEARESEHPSLSIADLLSDTKLGFELRVIAGDEGLTRRVHNARVQKSGLALAGHFHGVERWRLQILGATEMSYLDGLSPDARRRACEGFASLKPCAFVLTRGVEPLPELVDACRASSTPLLLSPKKSSTTINALHALLDERLAPHTRVHGVLVEIFGLGVLLMGRSGIGKSECALDLVMRGHRLVADDVVECSFRPPDIIVGAPAELLAHHIEIRGLGILDVKDLFGVTNVRERMRIDLVVRLSDETESSRGLEYDRLGLDEKYRDIIGVKIPEKTIPVRPGRDMASIMEIAARNELLKRAGHHGARAFREKLERALLGGTTPSTPPEGRGGTR